MIWTRSLLPSHRAPMAYNFLMFVVNDLSSRSLLKVDVTFAAVKHGFKTALGAICISNIFLNFPSSRPIFLSIINYELSNWSPKCGNVATGLPAPTNSVRPPHPQWVRPHLTAGWWSASIWGSQPLTQKFGFWSGSLSNIGLHLSLRDQTTRQPSLSKPS